MPCLLPDTSACICIVFPRFSCRRGLEQRGRGEQSKAKRRDAPSPVVTEASGFAKTPGMPSPLLAPDGCANSDLLFTCLASSPGDVHAFSQAFEVKSLAMALPDLGFSLQQQQLSHRRQDCNFSASFEDFSNFNNSRRRQTSCFLAGLSNSAKVSHLLQVIASPG